MLKKVHAVTAVSLLLTAGSIVFAQQEPAADKSHKSHASVKDAPKQADGAGGNSMAKAAAAAAVVRAKNDATVKTKSNDKEVQVKSDTAAKSSGVAESAVDLKNGPATPTVDLTTKGASAQTTKETSTPEDAGTSTNVGDTKPHEIETGHHHFVCGGMKGPWPARNTKK